MSARATRETAAGSRRWVTALLEWKSRPEALIRVVAPGSPRVSLELDDCAAEVWARLMVRATPPDRVLLHVDATEPGRVLRPHAALLRRLRARHVVLLNDRVLDISKPTIQRVNRRLGLPHTTPDREGRATERIIVKTRWNVRGDNEADLSERERVALGYPKRWRSPLGDAREYEVLCRKQIPSSWWSRRGLFLERFITNRVGEYFRVYVSGSRVAVCAFQSTTLVKRPEHSILSANYLLHRELASEPALSAVLPDLIWPVFANALRFANAVGLDYGAMDLVCDDRGVPYIVDVNLTPSRGKDVDREFRDHLRAGLRHDS